MAGTDESGAHGSGKRATRAPAGLPVLHSRGADGRVHALGAVALVEGGGEPPALRPMDGAPVAPVELLRLGHRALWGHEFSLPARGGAFYRFGDARVAVAADCRADLRIGYVACNGAETEPEDAGPERDAVWARLAAEHARGPLHLLLHGGDQIYADAVVESHPALARWADTPARERGELPFPDEAREAARRWWFDRYAALRTRPAVGSLLASVPSVSMWDDHDIMDGWGSHPAPLLDGPVGRGLFAVAREMFLAFQLGASEAHPIPETPLARVGDPAGPSLGQDLAYPGVDVIAPDLRSERRPDRVMGAAGWAAVERALARPAPARRLVMSSVPLLGPRLSLLERCIGVVPKARRYEDDLRDQWQSRAHRVEWRRMLEALDGATPPGAETTVLSGEIHLAGRAEMALGNGSTLHQLVSSGVAHPAPPRAFARALGALARLGDDPLPGRPIRILPLPGRSERYVAERNWLLVERRAGRWTARWELELGGWTETLELGADEPASEPLRPNGLRGGVAEAGRRRSVARAGRRGQPG